MGRYTGEMWEQQDVRCAWGDVGRYRGEIWGDIGEIYGEIWGDMGERYGRYGEIWGDIGERYGKGRMYAVPGEI